MNKTANLYVRVNPQIKQKAEDLYASFGLTISDAINIFLSKSIMENGLPFELKHRQFNEQTLEALNELDDMKSGKIARTNQSVDEFIQQMRG